MTTTVASFIHFSVLEFVGTKRSIPLSFDVAWPTYGTTHIGNATRLSSFGYSRQTERAGWANAQRLRWVLFAADLQYSRRTGVVVYNKNQLSPEAVQSDWGRRIELGPTVSLSLSFFLALTPITAAVLQMKLALILQWDKIIHYYFFLTQFLVCIKNVKINSFSTCHLSTHSNLIQCNKYVIWYMFCVGLWMCVFVDMLY